MSVTTPNIDEALCSNDKAFQRNLVFYVNGQRYEIENPQPKALLVDFLR